MSEKMPRKFTFDEYYEMLKEYVTHPKALEALALYDAEYAAGRGWVYQGGSELATDANTDFIVVGWSILGKHGWPTYSEALELQKNEGLENITTMGTSFSHVARRLIRKEPESKYPDRSFTIKDKESVLEYLVLRLQECSKYELYDLQEGE